MVDAIVGSIRKLRFEVLGSGSEPDDTSWKAKMGIEPQVERTRQAMRWVQDMSAGGGFGFDIGEIEGVSVGGTLLDYYDAYIRHAANVHRFVRSPILHSYVFLWLMSKYGDIHEGSEKIVRSWRIGWELKAREWTAYAASRWRRYWNAGSNSSMVRELPMKK